MAPRGQTLPQAATESAREARKSFFCELCQKGYARMNEFEAHEGSYDHQHRKRMKELKQLSKDPNAAAKARAAEEKAKEEAGMKSISIPFSGAGSGGQKKKPVFKSTLQPHNAAALGVPSDTSAPTINNVEATEDMDTTDRQRKGDFDDLTEEEVGALYGDMAKENGWADRRYDPDRYDPLERADLARRRQDMLDQWHDPEAAERVRLAREENLAAIRKSVRAG